MPIPYTPDRELTPPESDLEEDCTPDKCDVCKDYFGAFDLHLHQQNGRAYMVCSECLNNLNQDINLKIRK